MQKPELKPDKHVKTSSASKNKYELAHDNKKTDDLMPETNPVNALNTWDWSIRSVWA